ncbi:MAG: hypothetical protein R3C05_10055 [Pirellulaceae bacterium]
MSTITPHRYPTAIKGKLQTIRLRHAALSLSFALALGFATWMLFMVVSMAIDWMYPFASSWLRIVLTSTTGIAALAVAGWLGIGPIRRALQWAQAADAVDREIPELEERWLTVTSLSATDDSKLSPIERAMAAQVTSEAVAMERIVQPRRVASPVALRPALAAVMGGGCCLACMFVLSPEQTSVLLRRFFSPMSSVTATQLESATGDAVVPRGESIDLVVNMRGVQRSSAVLTIATADGRVQNHRLQPDPSSAGSFLHTLRVDESMSYRIRAGDGQTPWHQIQAIDYPELEQIQLTIEFPEYTGKESVHRDRFPHRMKVVQGSILRLAMKPVEPLQQCVLALSYPNRSGTEVENETASVSIAEYVLTGDDQDWYSFEMQLVEDVLLQPKLLSKHGLENRRRQFSRIDVIADKAPVARVTKPTDEMAVTEDATIDIEFEAHDDHGIASAELVIFDESQLDAEGKPMVLKVQPIPLDQQAMQRHVLAKVQLDLKELGLTEGQEISYAVRVTDNRDVRLNDDRMVSPQSVLARRADEKPDDADPASPESEAAMAEGSLPNSSIPEGASTSKSTTDERESDESVPRQSETNNMSRDNGSPEDATAEKTSSGNETNEKGSNEKGSNEKGSNEKGSNEKGSNEKGTSEKGTSEKGTSEKGASEKRNIRERIIRERIKREGIKRERNIRERNIRERNIRERIIRERIKRERNIRERNI